MKPALAAALVALALATGFAAGRTTAPPPESVSEAVTKDFKAAIARADKAETELAALREAKRRPRDPDAGPAGEIPPDTRAPHDDGKASVPENGPSPAALTAAREKHRNEIVAAISGYFQAHEGDKALAALKELAGIVPEGRDAAMKLAVDINTDVQGPNELRLPVQIYYVGLGDPHITDLMNWSLANPATSTPEFRVLSAWSIPYADKSVEAAERTIARFEASLVTETNRSVQAALIGSVNEMRSPKGDAMLSRVAADPAREPALRAEVLVAVATSKDPAIARAIESAAADPDPGLRNAARIALILRDPPATGVLVVQTTTDGNAEAAGVRAGDIIVAYNGRAVGNNEDIVRERDAVPSGTVESVPVLVVRDGREVTINVKTGRLGLQTVRPVQKK